MCVPSQRGKRWSETRIVPDLANIIFYRMSVIMSNTLRRMHFGGHVQVTRHHKQRTAHCGGRWWVVQWHSSSRPSPPCNDRHTHRMARPLALQRMLPNDWQPQGPLHTGNRGLANTVSVGQHSCGWYSLLLSNQHMPVQPPVQS